MPGKTKPTRGLTEEKWDILCAELRVNAPLIKAASMAGVDVKTARKALKEGMPPSKLLPAGKGPIEEILNAEKAATRSETAISNFRQGAETVDDTARRLMEVITKTTKNVIESRQYAGLSIQVARHSVVALLRSTHSLADASDLLVQRILTLLKDNKYGLEESLKSLRLISQFTRDTAEIMRIIDELEKAHLGDTQSLQDLVRELGKVEDLDEDEADHILNVTSSLSGPEPESEFVDFEVEDEEDDSGMKALNEGLDDSMDGIEEEEFEIEEEDDEHFEDETWDDGEGEGASLGDEVGGDGEPGQETDTDSGIEVESLDVQKRDKEQQ